MPTENRSSNTEMVSVPRELLQRIDQIYTAGMSIFGECEEVRAILSQAAGQRQLVIPVPDGYCLMPRQLNAENGAKALLLGEFKLEVTRECPECLELDEPAEGCEICDGEGEYGQRHTIPWDLIKYIYSKAVKGLALQTAAISKPS